MLQFTRKLGQCGTWGTQHSYVKQLLILHYELEYMVFCLKI